MKHFNLPPLNAVTVLRQYGLYADKGLGQNFLQDSSILEQIVTAADIGEDDTVLEIGPGVGSLTRFLAVAAKKVIAVELDTRILPALKEVISPFDNIQIVEGDILKVPVDSLSLKSDYLVVANIPYYITSAVIRHLLELPLKPTRIVLTIQKEVGERICAKPGDLSLLALSVQVYGSPKIAVHIPAGAFYPPPKVDSVALRIDLFDEPVVPSHNIDTFFKLAKAGFSQKRKTLRNSLSAGLHLQSSMVNQLLIESQIDPMRRAETLSLFEWKILTENYKKQQSG